MNTPSPRSSTDAPDSFWRRVAGVLVILAAIALFVTEVDVFIIAFGAVLYAVFLHGLAQVVADHTPLPYRAALGVIVIGAPAVLVVAGLALGPNISEQVDQLVETLPSTWEGVSESIHEYGWLSWIFDRAPSAGELARGDSSVAARVSGLFSSVTGWALNVAFIVVAGIFLAITPSQYLAPILRLLPPAARPRGREVAAALELALRRWIIGRVASMIIVGAMTTVGLYLLGVPLALVLGIVAGVLAFVPTIGPIVSAIPALLIASVDGMRVTIYVLALFIAIQLVESYLITPLIEKRAVSIPPAYVLMAQLLIGVLLGIPGLIVATPIVVVVVVLVQKLYVEPIEKGPGRIATAC